MTCTALRGCCGSTYRERESLPLFFDPLYGIPHLNQIQVLFSLLLSSHIVQIYSFFFIFSCRSSSSSKTNLNAFLPHCCKQHTLRRYTGPVDRRNNEQAIENKPLLTVCLYLPFHVATSAKLCYFFSPLIKEKHSLRIHFDSFVLPLTLRWIQESLVCSTQWVA